MSVTGNQKLGSGSYNAVSCEYSLHVCVISTL